MSDTEQLSEIETPGSSVTTTRAGELLGLSYRTVMKLVNQGRFPGAFKPAGKHIRIPLDDIDALKKQTRVS